MAGNDAIFLYSSVIKGHHVYKAIWSPIIGECNDVHSEPSNHYDPFTVCIEKDGQTVGHVSKSIRMTFYNFLAAGGIITCKVTGHRRYEDGLVVPCTYKFTGKESHVLLARNKLSKK